MVKEENVIFITWPGHSFVRDKLQRVKDLHEELGHKTQWTNFNDDHLKEYIRRATIAYIWNGEYDFSKEIIEYLKHHNVKIIRAEVGWFPQAESIYFDQRGTNGNSSLHYDPLDWLTDEDFQNLDALSKKYRDGRELKDEGYVFVPLQLPGDTQLRLWSPFMWMGQLIREARSQFPDKKIIFRRHPKDDKTYSDLHIGREGEGNLKDLICGASIVYGINSTVLLEAAIIGKPVVSIGKSFLNIGTSRRHALAALAARQIHDNVEDVRPWVRPGRGLEHLQNFV